MLIVFLVCYIGTVELGLWMIFIPLSILLVIVLRYLTKQDEYLVEIVCNSLLTSDRLHP
jgi:hypothetical protein